MNFISYIKRKINFFTSEISNNFSLLILVVLITIPFTNIICSLLIGVLFVFSLSRFKKIQFSVSLFLLIAFYLLMCLSYFWSIDKIETSTSLIKESPLLLIPLSFLFFQKQDIIKLAILKYYSYSILICCSLFLLKATFNYLNYSNAEVFFYHNIVTIDLNAIHFSVFVSLSFFYFLSIESKSKTDYFFLIYLFAFLLLLTSESIIFVTIILTGIYYFYYSKESKNMRLKNVIVLSSIIALLFSHNFITKQINLEIQIKKENNIGHAVINKEDVGSNIISINEAWTKEKFSQNDFFSGNSFRVYQIRIFKEIVSEENVFWNGLGLNSSYEKINEKAYKYNVFKGTNKVEGYNKMNFHNQYIQVFSELGFIGFILLLFILFLNIKNALKTKDFMHFAFSILMISLFLTESFLWRQRGVVFFTMLYCLFNLGIAQNSSKTE